MSCFCKLVSPFICSTEFVLIVHPHEAKSTVGTAWILRRSISNIRWIRSNGIEIDSDPKFLEIFDTTDKVPLLLFPGAKSFNLNQASDSDWETMVPTAKRPLFVVIDGSWAHARAMLRRSKLLNSLQRVTFTVERTSEYGFKSQPNPACLSSVEGVHRVIEILAARSWAALPSLRDHDKMIEIFREMVKFQINQTSNC